MNVNKNSTLPMGLSKKIKWVSAHEDRAWQKLRELLRRTHARKTTMQSRLEADPMYGEYISLMQDLESPTPPSSDEIITRAIDIALNAQVASDKAILFSGSDGMRQAEEFIFENPDFELVHTMPLGLMLEQIDLFGLADKGLVDENHVRIAWNIAGARVAGEASGDVRTFNTDNSSPDSTFRTVEIPYLLANDKVKTVNGRDKWLLEPQATANHHIYKSAQFRDNAQEIAGPMENLEYSRALSMKIMQRIADEVSLPKPRKNAR